MMFLTAEDLDSWLFQEVRMCFNNMNFLGCLEKDVVQEQRLLHYSRTGKWPDFSSKLGFSERCELIDVQRGKIPPIRSINHTGSDGVEFALDFNEKWLSTHNIKLPLSTDYVGHIKLDVNESHEFIKRRD